MKRWIPVGILFLALLVAGSMPAVAQDAQDSGGKGSSQKPLDKDKILIPEKKLDLVGEKKDPEALDAPFAFGVLKKLEGVWEGTVDSKTGPAARVTFHVTAGGHTLVESRFPGTENETVSVYYMDGKDLVLTHYGANGNQPRLRFDPAASTWTVYDFKFSGGSNLDKSKDTHVHASTIRFLTPDRIEAEWQEYAGSKRVRSNLLFLTRKPA